MDLSLLPWVLGTAAVSAVFGMAGGMVLLLVLTSRMPLPEAMVLHGILQLVANGSRALLSARYVRLDIARRYAATGMAAAALVAALALSLPAVAALAIDVRLVLIATGLLAITEPLLGLLHKASGLRLPQIDTPRGGVIAGAVLSTLHLTSGATGPLLDAFCVNSGLNRHENVATKAAVQSLGHALKIGYFAVLGTATATLDDALLSTRAALVLLTLVIASVTGTWLGRRALDRITDSGFRASTRAVLCAVGLVSLARGLFA